ncbi:glutamate 5-kinase [Dactylosporangium sp. CA-092794]|uniref:glutamate 5-kinase n=1 Tax=Dactylosporangium sp. CA-092794 TaxID=3239929 RepID=UPI003D92A243
MRTLVVKIGSSSVTRPSGPDPVLLASALEAAITLRSEGWNVVLVSSGAVSSGRAHLSRAGYDGYTSRIAAAVGQPFLMAIYGSISEISGSRVCQVLVSESDLRSAAQMATIAGVLTEALSGGIVPIVNGNDVADPLGSDNDTVAAGIAIAVGADKLLLLTDVPGVYTDKEGGRRYLTEIPLGELHGIMIGPGGTGRGGMRSKLRAAELAAYNGIETTIADAKARHVIENTANGRAVGTTVRPVNERLPSESRWIAGIAACRGSLIVNRQAEESIKAGSSLFASGVKKVHGNFLPGAIVEINSPKGTILARGVTRLSSLLVSYIRAMNTEEIAMVLTAIIARYLIAAELSEPTKLDLSSLTPSVRERTARAFASIEYLSFDTSRRLAVEILCLFPNVVLQGTVERHDGTWASYLYDRYVRLSSDLSLIDRAKIVVF